MTPEENDDASFSLRNFRLVLVQNGISTFATSIFDIVVLWMAITLTGSPFVTGLVSSLLVLPLVFNFAVGAAIDGAENKKALAIIASLMRISASAVLIMALLLHGLAAQESVLLLSALIFGFTMDIFAPVRLVWSKKYLKKMIYLKGMSAMNIASRASRIAGYLAAGAMITASLYYSVLSLPALYLASLVPVLLLPADRDPVEKGKSMISNIREGLGYIGRNRLVLEVIVIFMFSGFFSGMTDSTFTVEIKNVLSLNAAYLSYILILASLGGMAGSFAASRLKGRIGFKFTGLYIAYGASLLTIGLLPNIDVMLGMMFIIGAISGIASPIIVSTILGNATRDMMGRIQGVMDTFGFSFNSASGIAAGLMMGIFLPRYVFFVMASGMVAIALLSARLMKLRAMEL